MTSILRRVALCSAAACALLSSTAALAEPSAAKKELIAKVVQLQQGGIESFARGLVE